MFILSKKKFLLSILFINFLVIFTIAQQTEGTVLIETSPSIDALVRQKKQYNQNLKTTDGFKIQLFYGGEKQSYEVQNEFTMQFPEIPAKLIFSSPQWKVQVGNFKTRLEADRALVEIKQSFSSAIILATKIDLIP